MDNIYLIIIQLTPFLWSRNKKKKKNPRDEVFLLTEIKTSNKERVHRL